MVYMFYQSIKNKNIIDSLVKIIMDDIESEVLNVIRKRKND
jgi:hypothetical protein